MTPQAINPIKLNTGNFVSTNSEEDRVVSEQQLGQDDFLKLLVTELSNQDPLNPKGDMDYFAQMAEFTSLEQTKELGASLQRIEANSMIGKSVEIQLDDNQTVSGVVDAVWLSAGKPKVEVDGEQYDLAKVVNVISNQPQVTQILKTQ